MKTKRQTIKWKPINPKKLPEGIVLGFNHIHNFTHMGSIYLMYGFKLTIKAENGNEYPVTHYLDPKKFKVPKEKQS